jgi:hypothetical protein
MPDVSARKSRTGRAGTWAAVAVAAATVLAAGCGSSDSSGDRPAPSASAFPAANDRSLDQILSDVGEDNNIAVSPTGAVFSKGDNRFGFGIFHVDNSPIANADVAMYAAPLAGGPAQGPFPARYETLATEPRFEAQSTSSDPDAAKGFYASDVTFDRPGAWNMIAVIRTGDQLSSARVNTSVIVDHPNHIPEVGQKAPVIHTLTAADVSGDFGKIDTRVPHDDMHDVDFADVVGKQPVVLLFATPALCQSRVCGPVVDVAEQVEHEPTSSGVAFIHQEIYNNNNASDGLRPQVLDYGLRTEPWLFVVGKDGRISTRIEGAFSVPELEAAVKKVTG